MAPDDFSPGRFDLDALDAEVAPRPDLVSAAPCFSAGAGKAVQRPVLYSVPCSRPLYEAAEDLARRRGVGLGEMVNMTLILVAPAIRSAFADPGSGLGVAALPPPVLKLTLPPGLDHRTIRQTIAAMLALANPNSRLTEAEERVRFAASVDRVRERNRTFRAALEALAFDPLPEGPQAVAEAAAILGLPGPQAVDRTRIARRFRTLARIFHPDAGLLPSGARMAQVIEARNLLLRRLQGASTGPAPR